MAFNIEFERHCLDRYITYWLIKYHDCEHHICDGCSMPCGCLSIKSSIEIEQRLVDVYLRYMTEHVSGSSRLSRARTAFWANLQFCREFNEYFWMNPDYFDNHAQYYTWRNYLQSELFIDRNEQRQHTMAFKTRTEKYKTWRDLPMFDYEELGI
jgi:hypothetical protein